MIDSNAIKFAKAKGGYVDQVPESLFNDPTFVMEKKYDGCRYRMVIEEDGIILQSRRVSKKTGKFVEKQDRVPHITGLDLKSWAGTVVEGEIVVSPNACTSKDVTSIMGCDAEKAVARQEKNGKLHWVLFDILFLNGQDVRGYKESSRRKILEENFLDHLTHMKRFIGDHETAEAIIQYWHLSDRYEIGASMISQDHMKTYEWLINEGFEGGMLKDTQAPYGQGWYKVKQVTEVDVICTGFTGGKGKYEGLIGAIKFGVLNKHGAIIEMGQAGGMDDETRCYMTKHGPHMIGDPLEVLCQEVTRKGEWYSLRHPRFSRWRTDISPAECTAEKLERELK